jgi:hypothetical protein
MVESIRATVGRPVKVTSPHGKEVSAELRVLVWTPEQRRTRAVKRLGVWWLGGLLGAAMPPHFPWLAIGLIGGPVAAWLASREAELIQDQQVTCPDCGTASHLEEQAESWPVGARCDPCRSVFWINPA